MDEYENRFDALNLSEEQSGKYSLCRSCKNYCEDEYESWWPYTMCGWMSGVEIFSIGDVSDTGGVVTSCPNYEADRRKSLYKLYLTSKHWKTIRRQVILKYGARCNFCGSAKNLDVHHLTYDRLFHEDIEDLVCLCRSCHSKLHDM